MLTVRKTLLTILFGVSACLSLGLMTAFAQTTHNVSMTGDLVFDPSELTIAPGDTVLWTNTSPGNIPHTATADNRMDRRQGFNSGSLPGSWLRPGDTFEFTFTSAGTFPYHCVIHDDLGMLGTINVGPTVTASKYPFTAAPQADGKRILVQWAVPRGNGRVGFKLLRGTAWDKDFVEVSAKTIVAKNVSGDREEYQFVDSTNVTGGTKYLYILKEVRTDQRDAFRGPAIVAAR